MLRKINKKWENFINYWPMLENRLNRKNRYGLTNKINLRNIKSNRSNLRRFLIEWIILLQKWCLCKKIEL
jgi:hypothetical protein